MGEVEIKKWIKECNRYDKFLKTELGQLYNNALRKTERYWSEDKNEFLSEKKLSILDQDCRDAQKALMEKLMELEGITDE